MAIRMANKCCAKIWVDYPHVIETDDDIDVEEGIDHILKKLLDGEIKTKKIALFVTDEIGDEGDNKDNGEELHMTLIYRKGHYPKRAEITLLFEDWVKADNCYGNEIKGWDPY